MPFMRSKRTQIIEPPAPVNPITGVPYGQAPPPVLDERAAAEIAAGQLALATAQPPAARPAIGYRPRDCAWVGARGT